MKRRAMLLLVAMGAALVLSSGVALALNTLQCPQPENSYCTGTEGDDRMLGTDGYGSMVGYGGNDVLRGFGGDDALYGDEGEDRMFGGSGDDSLRPGDGDDASHGGPGRDSYNFNNTSGTASTWGDDTITDVAVPDDDPLTGNWINFNYVPDDLTINLVSSKDRPEVTTAGGTNTLNWSGDVIDNVTGGIGDDTIHGNDVANTIFAIGDYDRVPSGSDTIFAGGGDDVIWVNDRGQFFEGDLPEGDRDRVDCGKGTDTVYYDGRIDKVKNCEERVRR